MTVQEKVIKLASMKEQISKIDVPSYAPMAKELKQVKEALQLLIEIITDGEGA